MAEVKPIEDMSTEELAAAIDAASKTAEGKPVETPVVSEPPDIEIKLETGQVYKGKTQEDIIKALVKAQESSSMTIKEMRDTIARISEKPVTPVPTNGDAKFDKAEYFRLLEDNPVNAQMYLDNFREDYKFVYNTVQRVNQAFETSQFHNRVPEFPSDDKAAADLMFQRMQTERRPWTADNLEIVYHNLTREGSIKPVAATVEDTYTPPKPPPILGGATTTTPDADVLSQIDNMTDAQLEAFLRKKGLL